MGAPGLCLYWLAAVPGGEEGRSRGALSLHGRSSDHCLQYPICLFGTLLAGAVVVNVNPLYTARELRHLLKDSGAETLVIFENFAHTLEQAMDGSSLKNIVVAAIGDLLGTFKGAALNFVLRHVQKQVPRFNLPGARLDPLPGTDEAGPEPEEQAGETGPR